jgi:hypothetical protein
MNTLVLPFQVDKSISLSASSPKGLCQSFSTVVLTALLIRQQTILMPTKKLNEQSVAGRMGSIDSGGSDSCGSDSCSCYSRGHKMVGVCSGVSSPGNKRTHNVAGLCEQTDNAACRASASTTAQRSCCKTNVLIIYLFVAKIFRLCSGSIKALLRLY